VRLGESCEPVLLRPEWTLSEDEVEIEGSEVEGPVLHRPEWTLSEDEVEIEGSEVEGPVLSVVEGWYSTWGS